MSRPLEPRQVGRYMRRYSLINLFVVPVIARMRYLATSTIVIVFVCLESIWLQQIFLNHQLMLYISSHT